MRLPNVGPTESCVAEGVSEGFLAEWLRLSVAGRSGRALQHVRVCVELRVDRDTAEKIVALTHDELGGILGYTLRPHATFTNKAGDALCPG